LSITRQAFYKARSKRSQQEQDESLILRGITGLRKHMPRLGGRKLYDLLALGLRRAHGIKLGRDKFFDLLRRHGLLVKRRRKYALTTNSRHRLGVYDNLVKDMTVTASNQVFVSDITYIRLDTGFGYLALVTDVYSRKVVGYDLSHSLTLDGPLRALRNALSGVTDGCALIHHSDRGLQYCSLEYTNELLSKNARISMSEAGNPYENAIAERVNGILKDEFMLDATFPDFNSAQRAIQEAIHVYNTMRPHGSLGNQTPCMKYAA
jgi:transposase InsO family protein